jgi:alpha-galactosidase/6-phospho-beta-glucosidase family protein
MLDIARAVERVAPRAFILNYTNPSGIVTEAVTRHTGARILGLCSGIPLIIEEDLDLAMPFQPCNRIYGYLLTHYYTSLCD